MHQRIRQLERELQIRQPGELSFSSVGTSFNAYNQFPKSNAAATIPVVGEQQQQQQQQENPLLQLSLVAGLQEQSESSRLEAEAAGLHVFSDLSDDSDDQAVQEEEESAWRDPNVFEEILLDDAVDAKVNKKKEQSQKNQQKKSNRSSLLSSSSFIDVQLNDRKHPEPKLPPAPEGLEGNRLKRRKVFETLLATEASYIKSLKEIIEEFQRPLLNHKPKLIASRHVRLIFHKIPELHQIHRILQISLQAAAINWDQEERIGPILAASFSKSIVLQSYAAFLNNYTRAIDLLRKLQKESAAFAAFLSGMQHSSSHKLPLLGIMVKPVQRFPQLLMVVKDFIRFTEPDHPDRYDLLFAQTQIENLTEQLNEIKRHSEQFGFAKQQLKSLGINSKSALRNSKISIIREDKVQELLGNQAAGADCKLILTTYYLLCIGQHRGQPQLKWHARLEDVNLSSGSLTAEMRVSLEEVDNIMRILSSRNRPAPEELSEIHDSLHCLIHDHAVMVKIASLVSTLKFIYPEINEDKVQSLIGNMQIAIQQKSEELRVANGHILSLSVRGQESGMQRKAVELVFEFASANSRDSWVSELINQKLALEPHNNAAWLTQTVDEFQALSQRSPLLVGVRACDLNRSKFSLTCAVPVCLLNGSILKTHIWCCADNGVVCICSLYNQDLVITETFRAVDSGITAVAVVPGQTEDEIWMATESAEIFIHSVAEARRRISRRKIDTHNVVSNILHCDCGIVLCGDCSGNLLCFRQNLLGQWNLEDPEIQPLSEQAIGRLRVSSDGSQLVLCTGSELLRLELPSLEQIQRIDLGKGEENSESFIIRDFQLIGEGIWVCFQTVAITRLYYSRDMRLVQSFDLQPAFENVNERIHLLPQLNAAPSATSMAATRGFLWIGTSVGLLYLLRLPRLDSGIPLAFGPPLISCHSHCGPTAELLAFRNIKDSLITSVSFQKDDAEGLGADFKSLSSSAASLEIESGSRNSSDSGSVTGVYHVQLANMNSDFIDATQQETATARRSTVARLTVAPEVQRWASHPNLLLREMHLREAEKNKDPEASVRRLCGSLLDVSAFAEQNSGFGDQLEQEHQPVVIGSSPTLSDIPEEENDVPDGHKETEGTDQKMAGPSISYIGPEILVSIGAGYRDLLRRRGCQAENGPSLIAFNSS